MSTLPSIVATAIGVALIMLAGTTRNLPLGFVMVLAGTLLIACPK